MSPIRLSPGIPKNWPPFDDDEVIILHESYASPPLRHVWRRDAADPLLFIYEGASVCADAAP